MKSGYFNKEREGGYTITNSNLESSYQYNLMGEKMLVCLDQNGFIKVQANPPDDILLIRRNSEEKYSKWLNFIKYKGKKYSNFLKPGNIKPENFKVEFLPEKAVYMVNYGDFSVKTTIIVPLKTSEVVLKMEIENLKDKEDFEIYPQVYPYINMVNIAPWDVPYWYLRTSLFHDENKNITFFTRLMNPQGIAEKRRNTACIMSGENIDSCEYFMERYVKSGDFFNPDSIEDDNKLFYDFQKNYEMGKMEEDNSIAGFQPVYASKYKFTLLKGEKKEFVQILSMLPENGGEIPSKKQFDCAKKFLDKREIEKEEKIVKENYNNLFSLSKIETNDKIFDDYVNCFLPLQMKWVALLDRGWPTGMRGTRDASNDFMGLLIYNSQKASEVLYHLFDNQREDGWFPRQIGNNKKGPHDLRNYVDGGVFALEFLYEYICYTKDFKFLERKAKYLNGNEENTIKDHVIRALSYYSNSENIGQDNLLKIREGDWFDGVNQAGINGKGQSVTVSCQYYMAVKYMKSIFDYLGYNDDFSLFLKVAENCKNAVTNLCYNKQGFFNGLKNDEGKWAFSDCDEDNKSRMFAVPNSFAVFSGVANQNQCESVFENFKKMKTKTGYKLFSTPFTKKLSGIGRVASGDVVPGLLGNYTVYNHGSQGFLLRACLTKKKAELAEDVFNYLLPYNQNCHPEEETKNPPYAIVNCYQDVPSARHRTGFSFLTGTVAMAVRAVYNFMFGIKPCVDGIMIEPCLISCAKNSKVKYNYNGKTLYFNYLTGERENANINGENLEKRKDLLTSEQGFFVSEEKLVDGSEIYITSEVKK